MKNLFELTRTWFVKCKKDAVLDNDVFQLSR